MLRVGAVRAAVVGRVEERAAARAVVGGARGRERARRAASRVDDVRERAAREELLEDLGRKRVIQVLFNVSVPRARVPKKACTLRDRSER